MWDGRYNRNGGVATWYGSSTEAGAWAEFVRSLPEGVDPAEYPRRVGRVDFEVALLDLTSTELQKRLRVDQAELVDDDWKVCQALADVAIASGYEAVLGPSAAAAGETTLAVFGNAIRERSRDVVDRGVQTPPR